MSNGANNMALADASGGREVSNGANNMALADRMGEQRARVLSMSQTVEHAGERQTRLRVLRAANGVMAGEKIRSK